VTRWANTAYWQGRRTAPWARLELAPGGLAFSSSYDDALIAAFKQRVPAIARRWEPNGKRWLVDALYGTACAELAQRILGVSVTVPAIAPIVQSETRLLKIEYLGRVKERVGGDASAFGWADGGWNVVIPKTVLETWFELDPPKPGEGRTLYAALAVKREATIEDIRSVYRRLARQWHPDVCREPDAAEQFKAITAAYHVLSDPLKRRKYDAGLALAASAAQPESTPSWLASRSAYVPPLRCGWVLATGTNVLSRSVLDTILGWEDIPDASGRVLVTTWQAGDDHFTSFWR
jgi:hypothetical protein